MKIEVHNRIADEYDVALHEDARTWKYRVTLDDKTHTRLSGPNESKEILIERSFEFLLDREPPSSILSSFDLTVIGRYFPEYEKTIRKRH